jgi:outer membrane murein-binding lipoprotein Lpp
MTKTKLMFAVATTVVLAGCQTTAQIMDASQPQAVSIATRRAQFEMNCPAATGQMLSREQVPPILQFRGTPRLEYTIGVAGCNQRATYLVICPEDGSGCFAAGARNEIIRQ